MVVSRRPRRFGARQLRPSKAKLYVSSMAIEQAGEIQSLEQCR